MAKNVLLFPNLAKLETISIKNGIFGFPVAIGHIKNNLAVSIGHGNGIAVAVAFDQKNLVGIDIETLEDTNLNTITSVLTEHEKNLLQLTGLNSKILYQALWAAKEAVSKSMRTGFLLPFDFFEIPETCIENENLLIKFRHFDFMKCLIF